MGFTRRIDTDLPHDRAVAATKAALQEQGFGTLTEIDLRQTLRTSSTSTPPRRSSSAPATRSSPTAPSVPIRA